MMLRKEKQENQVKSKYDTSEAEKEIEKKMKLYSRLELELKKLQESLSDTTLDEFE